jgi:hypothetical protein
MAKLVVNSDSLVSVADAIREKGNTTDELEFPQGFVEAVGAIESGGGTEITAGFTSEKYKKWLEINGYTIVDFTLTSQATADFIINHPLGRPAKSITCFRADLDGSVVTDKICFAFSVNGDVADNLTNRLEKYSNPYVGFMLQCRDSKTNYRAILENTTEHIKFRFVSDGTLGLVWASGNYYLAVL